ncbi:hypothetical protein, partial [Sphingomonas sanguinis]|uniref:hypothetical protein n=1 Tax=Sphingomonas sanguinis TaxID=33051 RepID=UPI00128EFD67
MAAVVGSSFAAPASAQTKATASKGNVGTNSAGGGGGEPGGDPSAYINAPVSVRPEHFALSPGGVDMRTGQYRYEHTDLSIGGDKGLSLIRYSTDSGYPNGRNDRFGTLTHNWDIRLEEQRVEVDTASYPYQFDYLVVVSGRRHATFRSTWNPLPGDSFKELSLNGYNKINFTYIDSSRGRVPSQYTFTAEDGTVITFRPVSHECGSLWSCPYASRVEEVDGSRYDLIYENSGGQIILKNVVSNRGYAIIFEYNSNLFITKSCIVNLARNVLPNSCSGNSMSSSYSYVNGNFGQKSVSMNSFVDQSGQKSLIGPFGSVVYNPGASTPIVTNNLINYSSLAVASQSFSDGRSFSYSWDQILPYTNTNDPPIGGSFLDNAGRSGVVKYGAYPIPNTNNPTLLVTPGPELIRDQNGKEWRYDYCQSNPVAGGCMVSPLQKRTDPEGGFKTFTYDAYRNVKQTVSHPKPGSSLENLVTSAVYSCSTPATCDKPSSVTDARGYTTDFTYDGVHGGVLTESGPADANGIRPVKRSSWVQRYAWL